MKKRDAGHTCRPRSPTVLWKMSGKRDPFLMSAPACFLPARHGSRFLMESEGCAVEPGGFEVLVDVMQARHPGLELSTGQAIGRWLPPRVWMRSPQMECPP